MPQPFRLIAQSQLKRIQNKAEKYDRLVKSLSRPNYSGTEDTDSQLGFAASLVPNSGYSSLSTIFPVIASIILTNAGINLSAEHLTSSLPSPQYIQNAVTSHAIDTTMLVRNSINANSNVYLSCDKGNKKGNKNLAKFFCWYNVKKEKVLRFLLDVNCVDEDTDDIFEGIHHSIKRFLLQQVHYLHWQVK